MAYAALISLKQTMRLLESSFRLSPEILKPAFRATTSLKEFLQKQESHGSTSRNVFYREIRDAARELEYALESHMSNQILSQSEGVDGDMEGHRSRKLPLDLEAVEPDINSFAETMENKLKLLTDNPLAEEEDDNGDAVSSRIDLDGKKSKIVGVPDEFISEIKYELHNSSVVTLLGMAGIGKTAVALKIFQDPSTLNDYELRAFVTVGPKVDLREILVCILSQMNHDIDKLNLEPEWQLVECLSKTLEGRKFLIVFDDVWTPGIWDNFYDILESGHCERGVLLTTRLRRVAQRAGLKDDVVNFGRMYNMRFLNKEESWDLLREKVFGEDEFCPYELEKFGRKIAENCHGLPLTIVEVARRLSKVDKTPECWNKITDKDNSIFRDVYDEISKVLFSSFEYLPQYLKACFLYMGVFPQNYEILVSKLIELWIVEGLVEPVPYFPEKIHAKYLLEELDDNSVVLVHKRCFHRVNGIKTCSLHSAFWNFCIREAKKEKFFHIINSNADDPTQDIEGQQRLCVYNNVLFSIKEVYDVMESISTVRSLLCTGPYHQYPTPTRFHLKLLKVLDALTIRFYGFPLEVVKLIQLRYLALTSNGELPASISRLWSLEYLIVRRHLSIKSSRARSYLPVEIWDMEKLEHLEVIGCDLPEPDACSGAILPKLSTLLGVSPQSCAEGVLTRIPNLKKLGIQIELGPDAAEELFSWVDYSFDFNSLESLKFVVVNPSAVSRLVAFPTFDFWNLKKLTLSGLGYPWESMKTIFSYLFGLTVLKLQCYAFRGPKWETHRGGFTKIQYLLIEDTDLVHWISERRCFRSVTHLAIRHCYKLKEIPFAFKYAKGLEKIELVDCPPSAVASLNKLLEKHEERVHIRVSIESSWEDDKRKS